ncbi:MAG: pyridoxamine 5'-phosphate oxidase family protein [Ramlibacter sp.]
MTSPAAPYPVIAEPFHEGEKALQHETGAFGTLSVAGPRVIRSFMPDQHRSFFAQLPWLVVGALDAQGQPRAHALAGPPGFVQSPDPLQLVVRSPLEGLAAGHPVGLLGIEPHTRRRNRLNGVVSAADGHGFSVQVSQSFGNCPKYIQAREATWAGPWAAGAVREAASLDDTARRIIAAADTFFIATAHPAAHSAAHRGGASSHGVDVSHRGGRPGFVRMAEDGSLLVPDYNGNHFFNTLGNIALNPRCGLLFIDFETGGLLQVAASAELLWEGPAVTAHPGAQRLLVLRVLAMRHALSALPLRWGPAALSPVLP